MAAHGEKEREKKKKKKKGIKTEGKMEMDSSAHQVLNMPEEREVTELKQVPAKPLCFPLNPSIRLTPTAAAERERERRREKNGREKWRPQGSTRG